MFSKQDLIKELTESTSTFATKAEAERAIAGVLDGIKSLVSQDEAEGVNLVGFGSFRKVTRAARQGRNPATGKFMMLKKRRVVTFKCAGKLKDQINTDVNSGNQK